MSGEKLSQYEQNADAFEEPADYDEFDPAIAEERAEREKRARLEREIGAKVLAVAGFNERHKGIVDSSFDKARKAKQKMVGKNGERRSDAYISRLERIIIEHGPRAERKIWDKSANSDNLFVHDENVPDSYWETQAQIRRDNGLDEYISDYEKAILVEDARVHQRESIKCWSDYLGQNDCPYPMWFKAFAWDGATKMSAVFDKESKRYVKRDESTMAPYPRINPAVLAKVYEAICLANGLDDYDEMSESTLDEATEQLVKTYNFNRIYSHFLLEQRSTPEVPKNTEDVHGDWVEYLPGDEDKLADAASSTPWCVASPAVGRNYLFRGEYGTGELDASESKAKFILFHLRDGETGELSPDACASIRLDTNGNVAEISGIQEGQVLDDSLVPIIEKKAMTLPGGKKYLKAFADKNELIRLDKKMQSGEELTDNEIRFAYELDRPIQRLEIYGEDTRIAEIRRKYPINVLVEKGIISPREVRKRMKDGDYIEDIPALLDAGVGLETIIKSNYGEAQDIDALLERNVSHRDILRIVGEEWAIKNADYLVSHGFTPQEIAQSLSSDGAIQNLDFFEANNIPCDLNGILRHANGRVILANEADIVAHGGKINYRKLARKMGPEAIIKYADKFCSNGQEKFVQKALKKLRQSSIKYDDPDSYYAAITDGLDAILNSGIEVDDLKEAVENSKNRFQDELLRNLDALLARGIKPSINLENIFFDSENANEMIEIIANHPEMFDLQSVYESMDDWTVRRTFDALIQHGIDIDVHKIAQDMTPQEKLLRASTLREYGVEVDLDKAVNDIEASSACWLLDDYMDELRENGVDIHKLAQKLMSDDIGKSTKIIAKPILWRLGFEESLAA